MQPQGAESKDGLLAKNYTALVLGLTTQTAYLRVCQNYILYICTVVEPVSVASALTLTNTPGMY